MQREAPVARMVREAIETVATPEVRLQILHRALHMAREHEIPEAGEPLRQFADKHLRTAMAFFLGNEASEAVMQNLAPMLTLADRISSQPPRKTVRPDETRKLGRDRQHSGVTRKEPANAPETDLEVPDRAAARVRATDGLRRHPRSQTMRGNRRAGR